MMKSIFLTASLLAVLSAGAHAQAMNHDAMGKMGAAPSAMKESSSPSMTDGVVKKVDKAAGTITLQHAEVKSVGMPAMTMAYKAKDAALLNNVTAGDKVGFSLEKLNNNYVIEAIERK